MVGSLFDPTIGLIKTKPLLKQGHEYTKDNINYKVECRLILAML